MDDAGRNTLERYELLDRVAVGGMAEVFRAKAFGAHGFEKTLAIKRILPDLASDPEFEERFITEAKLAVKLTHANIVQVLDFGRAAGTLFIAMEYVDGLDLAALLKWYRTRGELLPISAGFHISCEIARGLTFAHRHGVVHRDVSPSNVLLSRAGEVKLADFGIAQAEAEIRLGKKGERRIMGKWRYMSPEQTRAQNLSTVSDIFAGAAVIYEILTGDKLFPGDEAEDIIENIHGMAIPKASEVRPGLPVELDDILGAALVRDPRERTAKASILLKALIEVSYQSTIVASAFDVAESVEGILAELEPSASASGVDDLIRAQLGESVGRAPTVRKTAIGDVAKGKDGPKDPGLEVTATAGTLVRRGVDADGATLWELDEDTMAAGPEALRSGKQTGQQAALYDDAQAELDDLEDKRPRKRRKSTAAEPPNKRPLRRWLGPVVAASALGVFGVGVWYAAKYSADTEPEPRRFEPPPAPTSTMARLDLRSVPAGAAVLVDGVLLPERTPTSKEVEPDAPHRVEFKLEGYRGHSQNAIELPAGHRMIIGPTLVAKVASLSVTTKPSGATVELDGVVLGATPLSRVDLTPGTGRRLRITKGDFRTVNKAVDLVEGKPTVLDEKLVSTIQYAVVPIGIIRSERGGWANLLYKGKNMGRVPGRVRLPVGRQRVVLKNPETGASKALSINVKAGVNKPVKFKL